MLKGVIRIGDPTTHGGRVLSGANNYFAFGRSVSCIGDYVFCPLCKRPTVIVQGDPDRTIDGRPIAYDGCKTSCGAVLISTCSQLAYDNGASAAPAMSPMQKFVAQAAGAVKQIANDYLRNTAASTAATLGMTGTFTDAETGETLSEDDVAERIKTSGKDAVPIASGAEQQGADKARKIPALGMLPVIANAVISRGRSLLHDPKEFARDLEFALKNSRSPAEAIGKLGGEKAAKRLGLRDDPRYIDRYHGPDGMKYNSERRLTEVEYKGAKDGNLSVAKNSSGDRQGSQMKNRARSDVMTQKKSKKIGIPSNRQGGAYTQDEIDLWQNIADLRGEKDHISVHTNTETGEIVAVMRNVKGKISETIDKFKIENFDAYKKAIEDHFKELTK